MNISPSITRILVQLQEQETMPKKATVNCSVMQKSGVPGRYKRLRASENGIKRVQGVDIYETT